MVVDGESTVGESKISIFIDDKQRFLQMIHVTLPCSRFSSGYTVDVVSRDKIISPILGHPVSVFVRRVDSESSVEDVHILESTRQPVLQSDNYVDSYGSFRQ